MILLQNGRAREYFRHTLNVVLDIIIKYVDAQQLIRMRWYTCMVSKEVYFRPISVI